MQLGIQFLSASLKGSDREKKLSRLRTGVLTLDQHNVIANRSQAIQWFGSDLIHERVGQKSLQSSAASVKILCIMWHVDYYQTIGLLPYKWTTFWTTRLLLDYIWSPTGLANMSFILMWEIRITDRGQEDSEQKFDCHCIICSPLAADVWFASCGMVSIFLLSKSPSNGGLHKSPKFYRFDNVGRSYTLIQLETVEEMENFYKTQGSVLIRQHANHIKKPYYVMLLITSLNLSGAKLI